MFRCLQHKREGCYDCKAQPVVSDPRADYTMGFQGYSVIYLGVEYCIHVPDYKNIPITCFSRDDSQAISDFIGGTVQGVGVR